MLVKTVTIGGFVTVLHDQLTSGPVRSLVTFVTGISLEIPRVNLRSNGQH